METYIVLIPIEDNEEPRKNCEIIENNVYTLDKNSAYEVLLKVNNDLGFDNGSNIEVETISDFMDRCNDEEFNGDNYFISYVYTS